MIQKKVCMLGAFAVGKSSLVRQYVDSIFSETYTTTIGVKIDKKSIRVNDKDTSLLLWDVYGEDSHQTVLPAYLRGMAGYILVTDPSRPNTFKSAISLHQLVQTTLGDKPFVFVLNKADIKDQWSTEPSELTDQLQQLKLAAVDTIETSAKEDFGVDEMFMTIAKSLVPSDPLELPAVVANYLSHLSTPGTSTTVLKINSDNSIIEHSGELTRCGLSAVNSKLPAEQQIPLLSGLLPHRGDPLVISNTQTSPGCFVDVHVLTEDRFHWAVFVDNTPLGTQLQAEQQVRLANDIIDEKKSDVSPSG